MEQLFPQRQKFKLNFSHLSNINPHLHHLHLPSDLAGDPPDPPDPDPDEYGPVGPDHVEGGDCY